MLVVILGTVSSWGTTAREAEDRLLEITVKSLALQGKAGANLNVLVSASLGGMLRKAPIEATFDAQGECKIELPAGEYRFEVLRSPARPVRVTVSYTLDEPKSVTRTPVGFRECKVPGFKTSAPPHWGLQAANYLAKVRRVYHCIEEYEMKPARHRIEVRWYMADHPELAPGPALDLFRTYQRGAEVILRPSASLPKTIPPR